MPLPLRHPVVCSYLFATAAFFFLFPTHSLPAEPTTKPAAGVNPRVGVTEVFPFTLGKPFLFRDGSPPSPFPKPKRMVFTLDPEGNLVAEIVLARTRPTDARSGSAAVVLFNKNDPGPLHAAWTPFTFPDDAATTSVRVGFGDAETLVATRFFQLALTATGSPTPFAPRPDLPPTQRPLRVFPFSLNQPTPLHLEDLPEGKTQLKGITFHRGEGDRLSAVVDFLSKARGKIYDVYTPIELLTKDGVPLAAAQASVHFRMEENVSEGSVAADLGPVADDAAEGWFTVGLTRPHYWATISRTLILRDYDPTATTFPIKTMLDAEDGRVRACGLRALYKKMRMDGFSKMLWRWRGYPNSPSSDESVDVLTPYKKQIVALFQITDDSASLALLCRLAGYTGEQEFRATLSRLFQNSDAAVRDGAAIGRGILGDPVGERRIASLLNRPLPSVENRTKSNIIWQNEMDLRADAGYALYCIGTDTAIDDLGRSFVGLIDGIVVTPAKHGGTDYEGTYSPAMDMAIFLGHTRKVSVLPWFEEAMNKGKNGDVIARTVLDMVNDFPDSPEKSKFFHETIRQGNGVALSKVKSNPAYFDDAVALVMNPQTTELSFRYGLQYFERLDDSRALGPLREVYTAGLHAESLDCRIALIRTLAQLGDSRGLADLFSIAKDALTTRSLPGDSAKRNVEQSKRDRLLGYVRHALQECYWPEKALTAFLQPRLESSDKATRAAARALLNDLTIVPPELKRFAENKNPTARADKERE